MSKSVTHLAGIVVTIGNKKVQRCSICGESLIKRDYARRQLPSDEVSVDQWEPGSLITKVGDVSACIGELGQQFSMLDLPKDFCLELVEF